MIKDGIKHQIVDMLPEDREYAACTLSPRIVIGSRITQLRKARGMTQEELAAATGIRQEHLSRIEAGRYSVGVDTLAKIAEGLGCKIDIVEG